MAEEIKVARFRRSLLAANLCYIYGQESKCDFAQAKPERGFQIDYLIYEDKPYYDVWFKVILALPLAVILMPGIYSLATNQTESAMVMLGPAIFLVLLFWVIIPRRYCILDSKVKIILGGPFSLSIPFNSIKSTGAPKGFAVGVNFVTTFSSGHAVEIVRNKWLNVNITPTNRELFLENLDKALNSWSIYNRGA